MSRIIHSGRCAFIAYYIGGSISGKFLYSSDGKSIGEDRDQAFNFMWYPEDLDEEIAKLKDRVKWDVRAARAR